MAATDAAAPGTGPRSMVSRGRRALAWRLVHGLWGAASRAGTITADTPAGRAFAGFGPGSAIGFPPGALYGQGWIELGARTMVGAQVTLSAGMVPGQDLGAHPLLRIGDRCVIGRGSHIVAHHSIVIGDDVFTGPYVYITDQNHGYADPDTPIGRQWPSNSAVSIGSGSWLGAGVIVLPGACIGRNVVVAAGSVVRGKVPDQCVIAGVPARVVRVYVTGDGWSRPSPMASEDADRRGNLAGVCHDGGMSAAYGGGGCAEAARGRVPPAAAVAPTAERSVGGTGLARRDRGIPAGADGRCCRAPLCP